MTTGDNYWADWPLQLSVTAITVGIVGAIAHLILRDPLWFDAVIFAAGVVGLAVIAFRRRKRRPTSEGESP
jgi:membrane protein implicated in regulation of membrane protease activity